MIKFFHASKIHNYNSIIKQGLLVGQPTSNYGIKPKHNAIYLYHINNLDVACDFIDLFNGVDIYEVEVNEDYLISDEDSLVLFWKGSVNKMGTCAYKCNIINVKYIGGFFAEKDYINWVKNEIYF